MAKPPIPRTTAPTPIPPRTLYSEEKEKIIGEAIDASLEDRGLDPSRPEDIPEIDKVSEDIINVADYPRDITGAVMEPTWASSLIDWTVGWVSPKVGAAMKTKTILSKEERDKQVIAYQDVFIPKKYEEFKAGLADGSILKPDGSAWSPNELKQFETDPAKYEEFKAFMIEAGGETGAAMEEVSGGYWKSFAPILQQYIMGHTPTEDTPYGGSVRERAVATVLRDLLVIETGVTAFWEELAADTLPDFVVIGRPELRGDIEGLEQNKSFEDRWADNLREARGIEEIAEETAELTSRAVLEWGLTEKEAKAWGEYAGDKAWWVGLGVSFVLPLDMYIGAAGKVASKGLGKGYRASARATKASAEAAGWSKTADAADDVLHNAADPAGTTAARGAIAEALDISPLDARIQIVEAGPLNKPVKELVDKILTEERAFDLTQEELNLLERAGINADKLGISLKDLIDSAGKKLEGYFPFRTEKEVEEIVRKRYRPEYERVSKEVDELEQISKDPNIPEIERLAAEEKANLLVRNLREEINKAIKETYQTPLVVKQIVTAGREAIVGEDGMLNWIMPRTRGDITPTPFGRTPVQPTPTIGEMLNLSRPQQGITGVGQRLVKEAVAMEITQRLVERGITEGRKIFETGGRFTGVGALFGLPKGLTMLSPRVIVPTNVAPKIIRELRKSKAGKALAKFIEAARKHPEGIEDAPKDLVNAMGDLLIKVSPSLPREAIKPFEEAMEAAFNPKLSPFERSNAIRQVQSAVVEAVAHAYSPYGVRSLDDLERIYSGAKKTLVAPPKPKSVGVSERARDQINRIRAAKTLSNINDLVRPDALKFSQAGRWMEAAKNYLVPDPITLNKYLGSAGIAPGPAYKAARDTLRNRLGALDEEVGFRFRQILGRTPKGPDQKIKAYATLTKETFNNASPASHFRKFLYSGFGVVDDNVDVIMMAGRAPEVPNSARQDTLRRELGKMFSDEENVYGKTLKLVEGMEWGPEYFEFLSGISVLFSNLGPLGKRFDDLPEVIRNTRWLVKPDGLGDWLAKLLISQKRVQAIENFVDDVASKAPLSFALHPKEWIRDPGGIGDTAFQPALVKHGDTWETVAVADEVRLKEYRGSLTGLGERSMLRNLFSKDPDYKWLSDDQVRVFQEAMALPYQTKEKIERFILDLRQVFEKPGDEWKYVWAKPELRRVVPEREVQGWQDLDQGARADAINYYEEDVLRLGEWHDFLALGKTEEGRELFARIVGEIAEDAATGASRGNQLLIAAVKDQIAFHQGVASPGYVRKVVDDIYHGKQNPHILDEQTLIVLDLTAPGGLQDPVKTIKSITDPANLWTKENPFQGRLGEWINRYIRLYLPDAIGNSLDPGGKHTAKILDNLEADNMVARAYTNFLHGTPTKNRIYQTFYLDPVSRNMSPETAISMLENLKRSIKFEMSRRASALTEAEKDIEQLGLIGEKTTAPDPRKHIEPEERPVSVYEALEDLPLYVFDTAQELKRDVRGVLADRELLIRFDALDKAVRVSDGAEEAVNNLLDLLNLGNVEELLKYVDKMKDTLKLTDDTPALAGLVRKVAAPASNWIWEGATRYAPNLTKSGVLAGSYVLNINYHLMNIMSAPALIQDTLGAAEGVRTAADVVMGIPRLLGVRGVKTSAADVMKNLYGRTQLDANTPIIGAGIREDGATFTLDDITAIVRENAIDQSQISVEIQQDIFKDLVRWTGQNFGRFADKSFMAKTKHFLSVAGKQIGATGRNWLGEIAQATDAYFRTQVLIRALEAGESVEQAVSKARASLFNYNDLTKIERDVVRKSVWIFAFARQNIRQQLANMVNNPRRLANNYKLSRGAYDTDREKDNPLAQPFMSQYANSKIFLGTLEDPATKKRYNYFGGDLPAIGAMDTLVWGAINFGWRERAAGKTSLGSGLQRAGEAGRIAIDVARPEARMTAELITDKEFSFGEFGKESTYLHPSYIKWLHATGNWERAVVFLNLHPRFPPREGKSTYDGVEWRIDPEDKQARKFFLFLRNLSLIAGTDRAVRDYGNLLPPEVVAEAEHYTNKMFNDKTGEIRIEIVPGQEEWSTLPLEERNRLLQNFMAIAEGAGVYRVEAAPSAEVVEPRFLRQIEKETRK